MSEIAMAHRTETAVPPAVSIGMPVYNGEKYIREALDTLLGQSHTDFELIISDNASTDGTEAICQQYAAKDSRIRYVRQPVNLGALANFTFVLDEARGECFMWAAADDKWDSSWISEMLNAMKKTGANAAFGKIQCIDEHSQELNHYANNLTFEYRGPRWLRQLKYFVQFEGAGKANPIYAIWKAADLREIKLKNYQHDYLIVFDLLKNTEMAGCSATKIYKRIHSDCEGGGVSASSRRGIAETIGLVWKYLVRPIPGGLISEYFRLAAGNKMPLVAALPLKYLVAYWFIISNSRFSIRKTP
ncbi:MAG: glycosyltransferase [Thiobacillus sp.]|nr:glycosyltransferase [Thiobacillus sp.]